MNLTEQEQAAELDVAVSKGYSCLKIRRSI